MESRLLSTRICRNYPGRPAIVGNGGSCTYEDMLKGIRGLEKRLREMGVEKGSRVALWGYNSANWLIAFFAIVRAGGTAVLVNYSMGSADAAELLTMTETGFLLCGDNGETKKDTDAMRKLASLSGIPEDRCLDIRPAALDLGYMFRDETGDDAPDASDENATAFIIFTSGTTSQPKAVQISQKALTFDADAFNENIGEYAGRSVCVAVPLFHILGLLMSYAYLCRGATVCLPDNYKPETLVREIDAYRISDMAAVGAIYLSLADAEGFEKNVVPNLHLCMIAGGMSTPVQMMRLELQYANATFINMYGQSEAAPLTMVRPSDMVEKRAQTVGQAIEGMDQGRLPAPGRDRRGGGQGRQPDERLRQAALRQAAHRREWLAAHRRPGLSGRGWVSASVRAHQGCHHPGRREHIALGDRERPEPDGEHPGGQGHGCAPSHLRRERGGLRHHDRRRQELRSRGVEGRAAAGDRPVQGALPHLPV